MARQSIIILVLMTFITFKRIIANKPPPGYYEERRWKCVPVKIEFCQQVNYTNTIDMRMTQPNPFTDLESQEESKSFIRQFEPLVKTGCSKYLQILICSVFLPLCDTRYPAPITACRNLCEEVKNKCYKYLVKHGKWPEKLNCSTFPAVNTEESMCLDGGLEPHGIVKTSKKPRSTKRNRNSRTNVRTRSNAVSPIAKFTVNHTAVKKTTSCGMIYARNSRNYQYSNKLQACSLGCIKDGLYTLNEKEITAKWIVGLTCFCLAATAFSLFLILLNPTKFEYPEKPIICIVLCYFFYSTAFLIRIIKTRAEVSCFKDQGDSFMLVDGSANILCTSLFLITYSFYIAQNIWWVFLCLNWFLNVAFKFSDDILKRNFKYFHIISWGTPSSIVIAVLVLRKIDVDELTGMCSTGNHYDNLSTLREFIIAPLFTFLVMEILFLFSGFVGLYRRVEVSNDKLLNASRDIIQPGILAVIHTFCSIYVLSSYFYEYNNKKIWYENPAVDGPNFYIFLLRIMFMFSNGIFISLWTISKLLPTLYSRVLDKLFKKKLYLKSSETPIIMESAKRTYKHQVTSETDI